MQCKECGIGKLKVYWCKEERNMVFRYRKCPVCGKTYKTVEKLETEKNKNLEGLKWTNVKNAKNSV